MLDLSILGDAEATTIYKIVFGDDLNQQQSSSQVCMFLFFVCLVTGTTLQLLIECNLNISDKIPDRTTWLLYAVLIDLSDEVADELTLPFDSISIEMVFRGIYHFTQALNQGNATDIVVYLTAPENQDLGIVMVT